MNFYKFLISSLFILILSFTIASPTEGASASLYLSPPSGTYTVGNTFSVRIMVNSGGDAINAAEGTLVFNQDEVSVVSLSKSGSIFTLWTTEPTFSNSGGNIVFGGGTPSAFTGASGNIITITFKAKTTASAQISFSSGSVLAADGKGTNVLRGMNGGVYTLTPEIVIPTPEEVPPEAEYIPPALPSGAPSAPVISSTTHPDANKWYSNNSPEFSWKMPSGTTGVKLLVDDIPTTAPNVLYSPAISEKKLEDLSDGVWYFHIRLQNQYGWGSITHRKILIDTEPPEAFKIIVDHEGDFTNPRPILHFEARDSLSGVEYYEVKIGQGDGISILAEDIKTNPYKIPAQAPGRHTLIVEAFDKAGNSTVATTEVSVEPIEPPVITNFPETINIEDVLTISGTSLYPDATVKVYVKKEGEEVKASDVNTDNEGNWGFIYERSLEKGTYQVWAEITDNRGAKSNPTEKITIAATLPIVLRIGRMAIDYLTVVITLVSLIIVLILIILFAWRKISLWRKRVKKETEDVERGVYSAFVKLRKEIRRQVAMLDGKPSLSKSEKIIRDELEQVLKTTEKDIQKELKDVKEELE